MRKTILSIFFALLFFCGVFLYSQNTHATTVVCDTTSSLTIPGARNAYSMNFNCGVPSDATASLEIKWTSVGDLDGRDYFKCGSSVLYTTSAITSPYPNTKTTDITSCVAGENLSSGTLIHTNNAWNTGGYYYGLAAGHSVMEYAKLTVTYDDAPPAVTVFSPADNSTTANMYNDLVIYFDRATHVGTGNITIKKTSDDSTVETIDVTSEQVTGDGTATITIDPSSDLVKNTAYYVQIDATAFNDGNGNNYVGISDTTSWNFTTVNIIPPTTQATNLVFSSVASTSLTLGWTKGNGDGRMVFAKQASTGTSTPIEYTTYTADSAFGSGDQIGSSGWYTVYSGTGSSVSVTNLSSSTNYIFHVVEYNTTSDLKNYFTDESTNNPKVGYIDIVVYDTTSSLTIPGAQNAYSMNFGGGVPTGATASLEIKWTSVGDLDGRDYFKCGSSILYTTSAITSPYPNTKTTDVTSCVAGENLSTGTLIHTNNAWNTGGYYYGLAGGHSVMEYARLTVTYVKSSPLLISLSPADGGSNIVSSTDFVMYFDRATYVGTGNITIKKTSDDSTVETIDVTGDKVTGTGTSVITIDPSTLGSDTAYYIQIDSTAFNDNSGNNYAGISDTTSWNFSTIDFTPPTTQASNLVFSSVLADSMTVSWTNGNGDGRIVFMKQASSGTAEPVDATNYTANAAFGSGTQISSTGWYTVYKGTGTSVDITGLTPTNDYILQVFEYDLGDSDPLFLTDTATNNPKSQATPNVTEPGTQATNLTFSSIDYTTMTVSWSNGNGEKRVVFAKQASTGTTTPVDDTAYTANTSFGSGTQIGSTGWYTVYSGTGSSVDVTGLTVEKDYIFQVFEYNSSGAYYNYNANTGTNNPKSQATANVLAPTTQASSTSFSTILNSSFTISWSSGNGDGRVVFVKQANSGTALPVADTTYTSSTSFGSGTQIGSTGWYTVYNDTGSSVTVTGLSSSTDYIAQVFEYTSFDSNIEFNTNTGSGNPATTTTIALVAPTTQASNVSFSSITASGATVSWTNGNGSNRVVFAKASDTGTTSPVDQTTYTANTTFGSGTQIGSTGWYTVYSGTGTSVDVTGLSNGTDYIFQVFEYNGDAGDELYITSSASNNPNDTTTLSQPGYEDFETGDLTTFEWTHGGNADWSVVETSPQEGSYCVGSGDIGNSQNSYMEVTLNILEAGNVSFYQKVSAEFCCDKLRFYVNDVLKGTYTNSAVWTQQTYAVSTGTTTFKWYYYKDGSVSSGSDMAWVDYIDFPKFIADTHTLSYSAGTGGSISGDSSQSISEGENGTEVIAVPDSGYSFVEWSDGSTSTTRTDTNITTTTAYSASFVDTTAPSINNVEYSYASSTGSTFTWNTNEAASSQIEYGFNNSYGFINAEENAESGVTSHSMDLSNLYPCTTFHFRTRSYDSSDNLSLGENATFTTAGCLGSAEVLTKYSSSAPTTTLTSLSLEEGTSNIDLNIPPSYSSSTAAEFQMKQLTTEDVITETGYPSGKTVVGYHTYSLQALLGANSALTTFEEPLTVTISYTDDEISGLEESTLGIQRWDDSSWNNLTGCSVDTPNNEVTCLTSNFSTFGLFGEEQQQEEEVDGSSSTTGGGILSPPSVPIINIQPIIINNTVTFNVSDAHQMTISDNEDFLNSGYESYNEKFLISKEYQDGFYVKFRNLDGGVSEVLYVSKKITEVPESTSQENRLIKYLNSPKVYFIQNNKKKWITDEQSFNYFNYNWSEVIIIKDHIIFENGENIVKPQEKIINKKEIQKTAYKFIKNLERGHIGEDVKELQKYLNNNGFPVVPEGYPGAKGIETEFFGYATQNALIKFQEAKGIKPAVGYFGLITRSLLD